MDWQTPFAETAPAAITSPSPSWTSWANQIDPFQERYDQSAYPTPMYDYGYQARAGEDFDPLPKGDPYGAYSVEFGYNVTDNNIDQWLKRKYPELYGGYGAWGSQSNPGVISSPGGEWAPVDQWDKQILDAITKVQSDTGVYVPPNVVKALMRIESQGDPNAGPAYGLLQVTSGAMGQYDLAQARSNPAYGIWAGVNDIALRYLDGKAQFDAWNAANPSATKNFGWGNVAVGYFSGHYEPNGATDSVGTSDQKYLEAFNSYWSELGNAAGANPTAAGDTKQFNAIWGGFDAPITQEYGKTAFSESGQYDYSFGAQYTRDGKPMGHPGIDVGLSYGTAMYSPISGTVTAAGGTGYYCDVEGNGCGPGVGQLNLTLANGDVLVLGHMSQITLKAGDQVQAGQFVGYSGSENGAHVHVEYRKYWGQPGTVTGSGYEQIDPRLALQGIFTGTFGQAGTGPAQAASASGNWSTFMEAAAKGLPLTGRTPSTGGFRDFMLQVMGKQAPKVETGSVMPSSWLMNRQGAAPSMTPSTTRQ